MDTLTFPIPLDGDRRFICELPPRLSKADVDRIAAVLLALCERPVDGRSRSARAAKTKTVLVAEEKLL